MENKVYAVIVTTDLIGWCIETDVKGIFSNKEDAEKCFKSWRANALNELNYSEEDVNGGYVFDNEDCFTITDDDNYYCVQLFVGGLK